MNSNKTRKSVALAVGSALASGLTLTGSAFAMQPLAQGYLLGSSAVAVSRSVAEANCGAAKAAESNCGASKKAEHSCGAAKKQAEGKCGEGKCGVAMMDTNKDGVVERSEFLAMHKDKGAMFDEMDSNHDGKVTAAEHDAFMKTMSEGKCGEGKCGGAI